MKVRHAIILAVMLCGCHYPAYTNYPTVSVVASPTPTDAARVQGNLDACYAHLNAVSLEAWQTRKEKFNLGNAISAATLAGGSASTFFGDKTVKTIGGVVGLGTGLLGIFKGKDGQDTENVQARDAKARDSYSNVLANANNFTKAWRELNTARNANPPDPAAVQKAQAVFDEATGNVDQSTKTCDETYKALAAK